ncbi:hypothetical protein [Gulosibacter molinativorax]|uniref:Uncharacterized protein n=1 Tax=Gulosibacter molinativorax TaxID=256821 RepID=A0ABT7C667_9MICO|nr:hypothetical protein [Gulosibacter molinativorax]MDJ1370676.1 hypothetical protein [Gulosibacter molinativorax]QUY63297.1 Hypotetical protein [Gulosibacter molinativorax]
MFNSTPDAQVGAMWAGADVASPAVRDGIDRVQSEHWAARSAEIIGRIGADAGRGLGTSLGTILERSRSSRRSPFLPGRAVYRDESRGVTAVCDSQRDEDWDDHMWDVDRMQHEAEGAN